MNLTSPGMRDSTILNFQEFHTNLTTSVVCVLCELNLSWNARGGYACRTNLISLGMRGDDVSG